MFEEQNPSSAIMESLRNGKVRPNDPFGLSAHQMEIDDVDLDLNDLRRFLTKQIMLANMGDDKTVRLYQVDIEILINEFGMAKRDVTYIPQLERKYYSWIAQLMTTRAKGGKERSDQAAAVGNYQPRPAEGFATPQDNPQEDIVAKFFQQRKQKQQQR